MQLDDKSVPDQCRGGSPVHAVAEVNSQQPSCANSKMQEMCVSPLLQYPPLTYSQKTLYTSISQPAEDTGKEYEPLLLENVVQLAMNHRSDGT